MTLDQAVSGGRYDITTVVGEEADRRHLFTLGFTPSQQVKCLYAALAGDPIVFDVQGTAIALRKSQLKSIMVVGSESDFDV